MLGSPLHAIARYERQRNIDPGLINRVVVETGAAGAWSRLERGELVLEAFYPAFEADCAAAGATLSGRDLMQEIALESQPRPAMLAAVGAIRRRGLKAAALTNNWSGEGDSTRPLAHHFDEFFESSVLGLRKPDPRIYRHTCARLQIEPERAVFLDDIGRNLKTARELGMTTIKVVEPGEALSELERILGFPLGESISSLY